MSKLAEHYLGDEPYPGAPGFKAPGTSREAARAVAPGAGVVREAVFEAIRASGSGGLTADEAAASVGRKPAYVRPRVSELSKEGRIERTGERRRNDTGLMAMAWRAR